LGIGDREAILPANFSRLELLTMKKSDHPKSQADVLEERLIDFAVRIIRLAASLPRTPAGKHVAGQILRCGTSPAPNYGEARGAESRADFIHKIRVVFKELNETSIWLRIIERSQMLSKEQLVDIIQENGDLCKIFAASLRTTRAATK
jgi:four helix bundle protein